MAATRKKRPAWGGCSHIKNIRRRQFEDETVEKKRNRAGRGIFACRGVTCGLRGHGSGVDGFDGGGGAGAVWRRELFFEDAAGPL